MRSKKLFRNILAIGLAAALSITSVPLNVSATENIDEAEILTAAEENAEDLAVEEEPVSEDESISEEESVSEDAEDSEMIDDESETDVEEDLDAEGEEDLYELEDSEMLEDEEIIDEDDDQKSKLLNSDSAPVLTGKSVWRTSATSASVKFHTDKAGTYYYKVTDSATAPTAEVIRDNNTGVEADAAGMVKIEDVTGLLSGAQYVHVVLVDEDDQESNVHTIAMPYDKYYFDDFESYDVDDTYIAGENSPLAPISQKSGGTGNADQKVVDGGYSGNGLQLKSTGNNASDQIISLADMSLGSDDCFVLEGKLRIDGSGTGTNGVFRFSLMNGTGYSVANEAGIHIENYRVYRHYQSKNEYQFGTVDADNWYTVKIVAIPSTRSYALYINDELICNDALSPNVLDYIGLSSYRSGQVYYDELEFYTGDAITVSFDSDGGSAVASQVISVGGLAIEPDDPLKDGYSFNGWKLDSSLFDFETHVSESITLIADWEETDPVISGNRIWRESATKASIRFYTNASGTAYYYVSDSETAPSKEEIISNKTGSANVGTMGLVTLNNLEGLISGEKYVHVVLNSKTSKVSNILTFYMPYDVYYFDDFESYPLDTYVAQSGTPMSPLTQRNNGSNDISQKVIAREDGGNMLQIAAESSGQATRSDHYISLSSDVRNVNRDWVLEGDICLPDDGSGKQLYLLLGRWDSVKNGICVQENKVFDGSANEELCDFAPGTWHHIMIKAYPTSNTYDVVMDGITIGQALEGNVTGTDQIWISTGERDSSEDSRLAQFDNLEFYTVQSESGWVTTYAELQAALADDETQEVVVANEIQIPNGAVVDGNGKTVRVPIPYINEDGSINNTSSSSASNFYMLYAYCTSAVIQNMTVIGGSQSAIRVYGNGNGNTLTVRNVTATRSSTGFDCNYEPTMILENCIAHHNAVGVRATGSATIIMDSCSVNNNFECGTLIIPIDTWRTSCLRANNCVIADNGGSSSTCYGAGISLKAATGNRWEQYPENVYLTNCTITGNVLKTNNTATEYAGGIGLYWSELYAANCVIVDNIRINDEGIVTKSDIGVGFNKRYSVLNLKSTVYGYLNEVTDEEYAPVISDDCTVDTSYSTASAYVRSAVRIPDGYSPAFKHPATLAKDDDSDALYVPISGSGPAASGGVKTYFDYADGMKMGYSDDGGVTITKMGGLGQPDSSHEVTSYYGGADREDGVIGASASDGIVLKPVLWGRSVWRTDATTATIRFSSDSAGTYYYKISDSDEKPTAEEIKSGYDGNGESVDGIITVALPASKLGSGAKYVHIVVESSLLSDVHTIDMPHDQYYFEDFESYEAGTYIHKDGEPLSPLSQKNEGRGDNYQKVAYISGVGNLLQLESSQENPSVISDQRIVLPEQMRSTNSVWVLESDFCVVSSSGGDQLILSFADDDAEVNNGIWINGNRIYSGNKESNLASNTIGARRHVTLKVYAWKNTYDVIVDDAVIGQGLIGTPTQVNAIRLSPGNTGNRYNSYIAQYDNLEYYTIPAYTVTFDTDGAGTIDDQIIISGELAEKPENPKKEGADFLGWLLDDSAYDFNTPVTGDITLKADWDNVGPVLSGKSVWRTNATTAMVKFYSNTSGTYYYKVTDSATAPDAADIISDYSGSGDAVWGFNKIASVEGLTSGARYVHIVVKYGNQTGDAYTIELPYDSYYYDDFESYEGGEYIKQDGDPLEPIHGYHEGIGWSEQKVVDIDEHGKTLRLKATGWASDQVINLSPMSRPENSIIVLEGKFNILDAGTNDGLRFVLMYDYDYGTSYEAGLHVVNHKMCRHHDDTTTYNFGEATYGEWYKVKVVAVQGSRKYSLYINDELVGEDIPAPRNIDYVGISSYWKAETLIDDIKVYVIPPVTVAFDSNGGSEVAAQTITYGSTATEPEAPTKDDCTFNEWLLDGQAFDFTTPLVQDTTLVADWIIGVHPEVTIEGWTFGEQAKEPSIVEGTNPGGGAVTFEYKEKDAEDTSYVADVPTEGGNYTVRATVAATGSYSAGTGTADFTIAKAHREDLAVEDTVPNKIGVSNRQIQLPAIPEGTSYSNTGIAVGGRVPELISGTPVVSETTLTYGTTAQDPGCEATITIPIDGGRNYENYILVATISTDGMYVEFKDDITVFTYTGTKITPEVDVYNNGELLKQGVDYTVSYSGNVKVSRDKTGAVIAGAKVTIKGKGNLSNSKVLTFKINPKDIGDGAGNPADGIQTGTINIAVGQKATAPVITFGSYKLGTKDYVITDPMNGKPYTEADDYQLKVEGKGNFTGWVNVPVRVIEDKKNLKKFNVVADTKTALFFDPFATEVEVKDILTGRIQVYDSVDKSKSNPLIKDTDFIITYPSDLINAGKKSLTIIGTGNYSGSVTKAFTIKPLVVKAANGNGSVTNNPDYVSEQEYYFVPGGVTVGDDITVTYSDAENREIELTENVDYKVTYTNNKAVSKAGKPAEYSITFLGNYKGTPAIKNTKAAKNNIFTILPSKIADDTNEPDRDAGFDVYVPDVAYTGKAGKYFSTPVVTFNGSTLAASNYTSKYFYKPKEDGDYVEITTKNKLTLPDGVDSVKVQVRIVAKGTVAGKGNYTGTIYAMYNVIRQKAGEVLDLSKARITIYGKGYDPDKKSNKKLSGIPYNGKERKVTDIDPDDGKPYGTIVVDYKIGKNYVRLTEDVDYELTYLNNINKGKAVIVINGTNIPSDEKIAFAGSKRTTLNITASSLKKYLKELFGL